MLGLDAPLVMFVDPEIADVCRAERERHGFADRTRIVARPLEAVKAHRRLREIEHLPTFLNADRAKDSPLFQILNYAKFDWLDDVMAENPFGTDCFAWIDAGISYVAIRPVTFPAPSDRVAVLEMVAVAPTETTDRRAFYAYERGRLAAGFVRGHRDALAELTGLFRAELDEVIACGIRPNEQQILSYLSANHPDLFAPYFGDYAGILCNWDAIRRDVDTVLLNLEHCDACGLTTRRRQIHDRLTESIAAGAVTLTPSQRERWLSMPAPVDTGSV